MLAGLVGGLGVTGTAESFVEGFKSMAFAAMLIGFARAVYVVLDQGIIIDTIVHACVTPLSTMPVTFAALGMMAFHTVVHFVGAERRERTGGAHDAPVLVPM